MREEIARLRADSTAWQDSASAKCSTLTLEIMSMEAQTRTSAAEMARLRQTHARTQLELADATRSSESSATELKELAVQHAEQLSAAKATEATLRVEAAWLRRSASSMESQLEAAVQQLEARANGALTAHCVAIARLEAKVESAQSAEAAARQAEAAAVERAMQQAEVYVARAATQAAEARAQVERAAEDAAAQASAEANERQQVWALEREERMRHDLAVGAREHAEAVLETQLHALSRVWAMEALELEAAVERGRRMLQEEREAREQVEAAAVSLEETLEGEIDDMLDEVDELEGAYSGQSTTSFANHPPWHTSAARGEPHPGEPPPHWRLGPRPTGSWRRAALLSLVVISPAVERDPSCGSRDH